ncbi:hypothetical protein [Rhodocaloribacter sp.]
MDELVEKARRLLELEKPIIEALIDCFTLGIEPSNGEQESEVQQAFERADELINEYGDIKRELKISLLEEHVILLPGEEYDDVRPVLRAIQEEECLRIEEVISKIAGKKVDLSNLSFYDAWDLADEWFHPWFSAAEYVRGLIEAGMLVIDAERLPSVFFSFFEELRKCYAFQQYLSVQVLCRTVLEIAVRDLYERYELHDPYSDNRKFVESNIKHTNSNFTIRDFAPDLYQMIVMLTLLKPFRALKDDLHELRRNANAVIHAVDSPSKLTPREMMDKTMKTILALYDAAAS